MQHVRKLLICPIKKQKRLNAGWWLTYPSEKYEFVSWDYYTQYMEKEMFQTTNQDVCLRFQVLLALFSAAVRLGIFRWTATPSILSAGPGQSWAATMTELLSYTVFVKAIQI